MGAAPGKVLNAGSYCEQPCHRVGQLRCIWLCTEYSLAVQGRSKALSRRQKLLAGAALAAVLALAVAAAVRPALWALGFAFARWRRIALLGYWVALLAAALPLMDWVSRRRKVPTIIVRKVRPIAYVQSGYTCLGVQATSWFLQAVARGSCIFIH